MFLTPYHCWKGSRFKKGVCRLFFILQEPLSGSSLWHLSLLEGSRLPLSNTSPPSHLTASFSGSLYKWAIADEMFWASTVVAVFLICLGVFHSPCQMNHELLGYPLNSARIVTLWILIIASILFFLMCQTYSRLFQEGLMTPKFPQGEETSSPWLGGTISSLGSGALGQLYKIFLLSLPGGP